VRRLGGLGDLEKRKILYLSGLELRLLGLPSRNQLLLLHHYPGSQWRIKAKVKVRVYTNTVRRSCGLPCPNVWKRMLGDERERNTQIANSRIAIPQICKGMFRTG
jgi:hypothetical protein